MSYKYVFIFLLTIGFFSCKKENTTTGSTPTPTTQLNIAYGTDALQKFDFYLPPNRTTTSTKVLIVIHGGAWSQGDKTDMNEAIDSLKKRLPDYAIFNINYRLAVNTSTTFPTQENDVKAAIDFISSKKSDYLISDKFVLLGVSAGAHLATLQAYKYSTPSIKAVADFFGPTDMAAMYNSPASSFAPPSAIASLFNGATPTTNATAYMQSSPINYVTINAMPTIIFHGGNDPLVKPTQSTVLRDALLQKGIANQYVFYPNESHGWVGANLTDSYNKLQAFLTLHVQ